MQDKRHIAVTITEGEEEEEGFATSVEGKGVEEEEVRKDVVIC